MHIKPDFLINKYNNCLLVSTMLAVLMCNKKCVHWRWLNVSENALKHVLLCSVYVFMYLRIFV